MALGFAEVATATVRAETRPGGFGVRSDRSGPRSAGGGGCSIFFFLGGGRVENRGGGGAIWWGEKGGGKAE